MKTNFKGNIGIEIECITKNRNRVKLSNLCSELNYENSSDPSIHDYNSSTENAREFKSKIYNIKEIKQLFIDVKRILKLIKVNSCCGLHVHLSFDKMPNYYKLLCWKFVEQFENAYNTTFTQEIEQQRKNIRWCKVYGTEINFNLDSTQQVSNSHKGNYRYHSVNFNAFNQHKTVEFRIFPGTNKIMTFKKYVNFLVKNVDDFLKTEKFNAIEVAKKMTTLKPKEKVIIREIIKRAESNSGENQNVQH